MSRRLLTLFAVLGLALAMMSPISAGAASPTVDLGGDSTVVESEYGSYIVVMKAEPLIVEFGQDGLNSQAAERKGKGLAKGHDKALEDAGVSTNNKVHSYTNALNGFSAFMSYDEARTVAGLADVAMVLPDELYQPTTDNSPTFLGLTDRAGPWQTGYDGEGVVVGVIDSGIWPEHPSFADDGSYPEAPTTLSDDRPNCEFGNTAHNVDDVPFECNNKLIGARQMLDTYRFFIGAASDEFDSARDDDGHGTHTASTAAGNGGVEAGVQGSYFGTISGIAPRAHVIAYKGLGAQGGFGSDLAAAIDQAVLDGVDVINYSVGGGPSLTGADDLAFLFAADAGVFVATSAGNDGPGAGTIGGPASVPWITSVGANTQDRTFTSTVTLGDGSTYTGLGVGERAPVTIVDAATAGDELCAPGSLDPSVVAGNIVLCKRGAYPLIDKSQEVLDRGGVGMVLYNQASGMDPYLTTHAVPAAHITYEDGLLIKAYVAAEGSAAIAALDGGNWLDDPTAPVMAGFSSRGPNLVAMDIIKPDVTAPGYGILAGYSPISIGGAQGELFHVIQGTSMSSPHVAGLFALIKQAHPDWTPAMAKSAIMTTAYQDVTKEDGVTPADPFDIGAGHIDPGEKVHKGSAFQPGLAYDAGFNEYLGFLCDAEPSIFSDPGGTCGFLNSVGIPTDASDLNLASIGIDGLPGSQTIQRTVTSVAQERGWRTYDVSVDAPEGFEVTVSPSRIRLKSGQSATYEVTISNVSAPLGEWRYGSLTWSDSTGHYDVYSPIAVNAQLFGAPDTVTGSGESGSASFDVTFGYTGAYAAAAHGLEPAVLTSDNVVQDPDQAFDPNDGYSNLHQFTLSGAAYFKVALPPESVSDPGAIDLDVFVYGPDGALAATSTNGGTNEAIEIFLPQDGTWSVYIHGWQTAGPSADYDMWSWVLSATPGGNLVVDSAPTSATLGATGIIDVSWTGATTGEWHLGAVSHTGDVGLMGLTLVEVDNR